MKCIAVVILAMLTLICRAEASEPAGDVKTVSGRVWVQRGNTQWVPVVGDTLNVQDSIHTGADGSIGISFMDGTRVSFGPSSEAALQDYLFEPMENQFSFGMKVLKGTAAYVSGRMGKLSPESVKITTPQATIGIRGTRFALKVE